MSLLWQHFKTIYETQYLWEFVHLRLWSFCGLCGYFRKFFSLESSNIWKPLCTINTCRTAVGVRWRNDCLVDSLLVDIPFPCKVSLGNNHKVTTAAAAEPLVRCRCHYPLEVENVSSCMRDAAVPIFVACLDFVCLTRSHDSLCIILLKCYFLII